jgi:hypothetical protein
MAGAAFRFFHASLVSIAVISTGTAYRSCPSFVNAERAATILPSSLAGLT